jgi:hypothetical protein
MDARRMSDDIFEGKIRSKRATTTAHTALTMTLKQNIDVSGIYIHHHCAYAGNLLSGAANSRSVIILPSKISSDIHQQAGE